MQPKFELGDSVYLLLGSKAIVSTVSGTELAKDGTTVLFKIKGISQTFLSDELSRTLDDLRQSIEPVRPEVVMQEQMQKLNQFFKNLETGLNEDARKILHHKPIANGVAEVFRKGIFS